MGTPSTRSLSVTDKLRDMLLKDEFEPNARLHEITLAEKMQVSRTPIRESLRTLAQEGLLVYSPNRGYMVRQFTLNDILKAFKVRGVLEGLSCRLAAEKGLGEQKEQTMTQLLAQGDRMLTRRNVSQEVYTEWGGMNGLFHETLLDAADNELLTRLTKDAASIPILFDGAFHWYNYDELRRSHDLHHAIYGAIMKGQNHRAEMLMQEHIYHASEIVRVHFS